MSMDIDQQAREILARELDSYCRSFSARQVRAGGLQGDATIQAALRAITAALRAAPEGANSLLREVCEQLDAVGCGACTGSYAPMEDLHGRIAGYLAPTATIATVKPPGDLRTELGEVS